MKIFPRYVSESAEQSQLSSVPGDGGQDSGPPFALPGHTSSPEWLSRSECIFLEGGILNHFVSGILITPVFLALETLFAKTLLFTIAVLESRGPQGDMASDMLVYH